MPRISFSARLFSNANTDFAVRPFRFRLFAVAGTAQVDAEAGRAVAIYPIQASISVQRSGSIRRVGPARSIRFRFEQQRVLAPTGSEGGLDQALGTCECPLGERSGTLL